MFTNKLLLIINKSLIRGVNSIVPHPFHNTSGHHLKTLLQLQNPMWTATQLESGSNRLGVWPKTWYHNDVIIKSALTFPTDIFDISVRLTRIHCNLVNGSSVKMVVVTESLLLIHCAPCSLRPVTPKLQSSSLPYMVIK